MKKSIEKIFRFFLGGIVAVAVAIAVWLTALPYENPALEVKTPHTEIPPDVIAASGKTMRSVPHALPEQKVASEPVDGVESSPENIAVPPVEAVAIIDALLLLSFDHDGNLLMDRNTLAALKEFHTQLEGSASADTMVTLRTVLEASLPETVANQLMALARNYFDFRRAEQDFQLAMTAGAEEVNGVAFQSEQYAEIKKIRRSYFAPEVVNKLFAEEEAQLPYMATALAVAQNRELTAEQRAQQLAVLREEFNHVTSRMDSPLAGKVLEAKVARMRASGATEAAIFDARSEVLGSAEAQRLADLDRAP